MARSEWLRSFSLIPFIAFFCNFSAWIPVDALTLPDDSTLWKRQHDGVFSVLGIAAFGDRTPHPRLEIRELEKNKDQWNVFLLGLHRFESVDQGDKLSYFQIAGIHGMPFEEWDGVQGAEKINDGYCPHRHHLFPTWHRPYLALVEEVIYLNARQAISEFPEGELKHRYISSLSTWRLPYWDWAAFPSDGQSSYPASVQTREVEIIFADGPKSVPNPLFSYTFHPLPDWTHDPEWQASASTVRQPEMRSENYTDYRVELRTEHNNTTNTTTQYNETIPVSRTRKVRDPNAPSRNDVVAKNLDGNRQNIQLRVYNLLAFEHDYLNMSSEVQGPNNIENIHGTIHNTIGGNGHMWNLRYSAFDPIFWLHHSNVDRLFAIWEALNANYTIPSYSNSAQTFAIPRNIPTDGDTPLKPFHKDDAGNFWTSNELKNTHTLAYTYPILQNLTETDTLIRRVNMLYSPRQRTSSTTHSEPVARRTDQHVANTDAAIVAVAFGAGFQYTLSVKAQQSSLAGSPSVFVFLGGSAQRDGSGEWIEEPQFIGKTSFVQQNVNITSSGEKPTVQSVVPLTAALEARLQLRALSSMDSSSVSAYLKAHLTWKIAKADGKDLACVESSGFEISVLWREIEPAMSLDEFPSPKSEEQVLLQKLGTETSNRRFVKDVIS